MHIMFDVRVLGSINVVWTASEAFRADDVSEQTLPPGCKSLELDSFVQLKI